jgi:hypothetical protein
MRKGGHRTWSDAPLPLGTVRIHGGKRRIKVDLRDERFRGFSTIHLDKESH